MTPLFLIRGIKDWIDGPGLCGIDLYDELPLGSKNDFQVGQFYATHIKYPLAVPTKVLELARYDPTNEENTSFRITNFNKNSTGQTQFPVKSLNLKSDERLYVLAGKLRTIIILGYVESEWIVGQKEKIILCLPIASFHRQHTFEHIISIQLFEVPHLFYIKPSNKGPYSEGSARYELIQPVQTSELQPVTNSNNLPFKLSSSAFKLLINHLIKFLYGKPLDEKLEEDIKAFHDIIREDLSKTIIGTP